jgi:hypothetical protein
MKRKLFAFAVAVGILFGLGVSPANAFNPQHHSKTVTCAGWTYTIVWDEDSFFDSQNDTRYRMTYFDIAPGPYNSNWSFGVAMSSTAGNHWSYAELNRGSTDWGIYYPPGANAKAKWNPAIGVNVEHASGQVCSYGWALH